VHIDEWAENQLVDPRGVPAEEPEMIGEVDAWPIAWTHRKVGIFSNKKPNADAMLEAVKRGLGTLAPDLTFAYGSKEPLAKDAEPAVLAQLRECDVVILASAECGGCTSWVCRDYISLERLGVPCVLIATHRFEALARAVLERGGVTHPHLIVPEHPVSGIPADAAQEKIDDLIDGINSIVFGTSFEARPELELV
jgi:hypothetical protein